MEEWRDVVTWMNGTKYSFAGFYQVSNLGVIRSVEHVDRLGRVRKSKIKKLQRGKSDYRAVTLCKNGHTKTFTVHKIVWESFMGMVPAGYQINHLNENIFDNRLENLSVVTPQENTNYGSHNLHVAESQKNRADLSKEVLQYDLEGNLLKIWPSAKEIQRVLGYPNTNITACCNKTKYHDRQYAYGYIWKRREKEAV